VSRRARIAALWAAACLGGLAATAAIAPNGAGNPSGTEDPGQRESVLTTVPAVDCEWVADEIRRVAADPGGSSPHPGLMVARTMTVPEECLDELRAQGLR
jgi:hypothetical protein